ncbi:MAG: hypothetical protein A3G85_00280 [Elusimicrobia bacterium RIFCSPLOWO2_12_FULL_39_28]|nr:MAG: hypothetical protein A3G85_00280 [Elusimicrobia bacterium RIFCSPLOWO2_12_FULL_39_28]
MIEILKPSSPMAQTVRAFELEEIKPELGLEKDVEGMKERNKAKTKNCKITFRKLGEVFSIRN